VSIWSNCLGYSVITVLTGEWEASIILPMMTRSRNKVTLKLEQGQFSE
jgi:hypothetical protein